jgi:hypothetical protein
MQPKNRAKSAVFFGVVSNCIDFIYKKTLDILAGVWYDNLEEVVSGRWALSCVPCLPDYHLL